MPSPALTPCLNSALANSTYSQRISWLAYWRYRLKIFCMLVTLALLIAGDV